MAILSFWSGNPKEAGQTLSIAAIATQISIEHNRKTLVVDATFKDDTLEKCFWKPDENKELKKKLNKGKLDIATGTEGLMSAIASNKTSPEIISNYTKVVFNKRFDVLLGLKTTNYEEYDSYLKLYPDMLKAANKFYDLVIVDLPKTTQRQTTMDILRTSDVVMYTMSQNLKQINEFIENRNEMQELKRVIPLLGSANDFCKYNPKNVSTFVREKQLAYISYNNKFLESASEGEVAKFFLDAIRSKNARDKNAQFLKSVAETSQKVIRKFEEIKYGRVLDS